MDTQYIAYNVLNKYHSKLACFDLDHTLIETKSNKILPVDIDDWQFKPFVVDTLQFLHNQNWSIIVFTNQKQCKAILPVPELKVKFEQIQTAVGNDIPLTFFAALEKDLYRKPYTGMWQLLMQQVDNKYDEAFFCGDAYEKKRFDDIYFAKNNNIPFIKSVDLFKKTNTIDVSSMQYTIDFKPPIKFVNKTLIDKEKKELELFMKDHKYIFIVGSPASGNTHFCKTHLSNYTRLSKDEYNTKSKYLNAVTKNKNNALVFDNTNHTSKGRDEIIQKLPKNASIGFIFRNIDKDEVMYLNKYRYFTSNYKSTLLPDVVIHTYFKNVEVPNNNVLKISHWIDRLETRFCI